MLFAVKLETKRLSEEAEELVRAKEQLCFQLVKREEKIRSLETELSTLSQVTSYFTFPSCMILVMLIFRKVLLVQHQMNQMPLDSQCTFVLKFLPHILFLFVLWFLAVQFIY